MPATGDNMDEFEQLLAWACQHNATALKKDQIIVDFDTGYCDYRTKRSGVEPNRNDPCSCGSGKKYKKCCLSVDIQNRS
jgi:hypothetical protein